MPVKWGQIKKEQWILLLLAGIMIMTILFPSEKTEDVEKTAVSEANDQEWTGTENDREELAWYERKLESILGQMDGAGTVRVMITESVSRERIVEKDKSVRTEQSQDGDDSALTGKNMQEDKEETTVMEKNGQGKESPYITRSIAPRIEGVLILAQGGDNSIVAKNITEAAMALFDIEAHKIKVIKMI